MKYLFLFLLIAGLSTSCYRMRKSNGGGQIDAVAARTTIAADIALHPGYTIEPVATGLTFPTGITFDESGNAYIVESGYSYGEVFTEPKLLRLQPNAAPVTIATGSKNGPWTGVTYLNNQFYIAEGGQLEGGRIIRIDKNGVQQILVSDLPTFGDHHTNGPVIKDGFIYFSLGTATNAGVVGLDNHEFGWLKRRPGFHDIPCADVTLLGKNYETPNPLTDDPNDKVHTGAFVPFGTLTHEGQVIKGSIPCSGSILRVPIDGGPVELVAWGFRNPFGLSFSPDGRLFTTENAFDERGSRKVWGTADVLWEVRPGSWYGWPDHSEGRILQDKEFKSPKAGIADQLLKEFPQTPPKPTAHLGVHSSSNSFDFSRSDAFGFAGEAFITQFGDMAPDVGKVLSPVGFKVVRVNIQSGVIRDFATNKGKRNGPASRLKTGGLERPVAARFDPNGTALYVVDFGIMRMTNEGPQPQPATGVVWKITKQ